MMEILLLKAGAVVGMVIFLAWLIKVSYVKAPPDTAYIISGLSREPRVLVGKGGFRIPFFERIDELYQGQISVDIKTNKSVPTNDFINVNIDAVAKICVIQTPEGMRLAAKNFLNLQPGEIADELTASLEGNMREIVGTLELKKLNIDRDGFSNQVVEKADKDMQKLGICILSCNIQNITDEQDLIKDLGADNTWKIKKDAANQRSIAEREIKVVSAENEKIANDAWVASQTEIAIKKNDLAIKQAELKKISDNKQAEADAAYQIQQNEQKKTINEKEVEADIARTLKQQELTQQRVKVSRNELEAEVNNRADADKYQAVRSAEAEMEQRKRLAEALKYEAEQEAAAIKAKGDAQAYAIKAQGEAEAQAMERKAEAYRKYNDAAIIQMVIEKLPEMTDSVAKQVSAIDSVNIYGTDASGVSRLTSTGPVIIKQVLDLVKDVTGFDMTKRKEGNAGPVKVEK